nr:immunoglobulin heavy chain junction region [Macaca mulatta]
CAGNLYGHSLLDVW